MCHYNFFSHDMYYDVQLLKLCLLKSVLESIVGTYGIEIQLLFELYLSYVMAIICIHQDIFM